MHINIINDCLFLNNLVSYCKISKMKFFFLEKSNLYILLPDYLFIKKINSNFYFYFYNIFFKSFDLFFNFLLKFLNRLIKINRIKIFFSGLGFRVNFLSKDVLSFKIGFSHLVNLNIPFGVSVVLVKNNIYIESFNPSLLGSFANKIKNLKYPDSYKGKGFWIRSEKKKLKQVKKS